MNDPLSVDAFLGQLSEQEHQLLERIRKPFAKAKSAQQFLQLLLTEQEMLDFLLDDARQEGDDARVAILTRIQQVPLYSPDLGEAGKQQPSPNAAKKTPRPTAPKIPTVAPAAAAPPVSPKMGRPRSTHLDGDSLSTKGILLTMPTAYHQALKIVASVKGTTMTDVLLEMLSQNPEWQKAHQWVLGQAE